MTLAMLLTSALTCLALDWLALHPTPIRPHAPTTHEEPK